MRVNLKGFQADPVLSGRGSASGRMRHSEVIERYRRLQEQPAADRPEVRVALLCSFTAAQLEPYLAVAADECGVRLVLHSVEDTAVARAILDPAGELAQFAPDYTYCWLRWEDRYPELVTAGDDQARVTAREEYLTLLRTLATRVTGRIIIVNQAPPVTSISELYTLRPESPARWLAQLNEALALLAEALPNVAVFDFSSFSAALGAETLYDPAHWYLARMPWRTEQLGRLANALLIPLRTERGRNRKCLLLDLDNVLWGGLLGEEGQGGIALATTYPGNIYRDFQRYLLELHRRGILLAIVSKNDPVEVAAVLRDHPAMVLRGEQFSAIRCGWEEKHLAVRAIARELNLGLDSLVFFDDSPVEREKMRTFLPEVLTVDAPVDPAGYIAALRELTVFETAFTTDADQQRAEYYARRERREAERRECATLDEFLRRQELRLFRVPADGNHFPRICQLVQRTNQFNLTSRRYRPDELRALLTDPEYEMLAFTLTDRHGDHGLIALLIMQKLAAAEAAEIIYFAMSCRVIGLTLEDKLLAVARRRARAHGAERLRGVYVPTAKNAVVRNLFYDHGFVPLPRADGAQGWELGPERELVDPDWIVCSETYA